MGSFHAVFKLLLCIGVFPVVFRALKIQVDEFYLVHGGVVDDATHAPIESLRVSLLILEHGVFETCALDRDGNVIDRCCFPTKKLPKLLSDFRTPSSIDTFKSRTDRFGTFHFTFPRAAFAHRDAIAFLNVWSSNCSLFQRPFNLDEGKTLFQFFISMKCARLDDEKENHSQTLQTQSLIISNVSLAQRSHLDVGVLDQMSIRLSSAVVRYPNSDYARFLPRTPLNWSIPGAFLLLCSLFSQYRRHTKRICVRMTTCGSTEAFQVDSVQAALQYFAERVKKVDTQSFGTMSLSRSRT